MRSPPLPQSHALILPLHKHTPHTTHHVPRRHALDHRNALAVPSACPVPVASSWRVLGARGSKKEQKASAASKDTPQASSCTPSTQCTHALHSPTARQGPALVPRGMDVCVRV